MADEHEAEFRRLLLEEIRAVRNDMISMRSEMVSDITDLKSRMSQLQASEAQQEKETLAFWAERWGPLKSDIQDIRNRLGSLEQKDVKMLERRLDDVEKHSATVNQRLKSTDKEALSSRVMKLEKNEMKKQGIAVGVGLLSGGGISALVQWLMNGF